MVSCYSLSFGEKTACKLLDDFKTLENTLNNGKILRSGFVYSLGIITLYVVLNLIKNYNAPDLSYIMNVYQIEPYVEFNSSHTGCLSIPPRWVNWCVDVPVNERYCDDYECIK